jgi:hypothetical protein
MNRQRIILLTAALLVVAAVALAAWRWRPANNDNFPDGTFWICRNPQCHAEFVLSMKQLGEHHRQHYGQPVPCPQCGKTDTTRAERCPNCKKFYPMQRDLLPCPHCQHKPAPPQP